MFRVDGKQGHLRCFPGLGEGLAQQKPGLGTWRLRERPASIGIVGGKARPFGEISGCGAQVTRQEPLGDLEWGLGPGPCGPAHSLTQEKNAQWEKGGQFF